MYQAEILIFGRILEYLKWGKTNHAVTSNRYNMARNLRWDITLTCPKYANRE